MIWARVSSYTYIYVYKYIYTYIHDKPRQCVEKQRHYSADKIHIVKAMVFPVVMYDCES